MAWDPWSGGFGVFGDSGGGGPPAYGMKGKKQVNLNLLWPLLMQASYANVSMGQDPIAFLEQFKVDKPKQKAGDTGVVHIGKNWYDIGALTKSLPGLLEQAQTAGIDKFNASVEKLGAIPAFKGIFDEAAGNFAPQFTADVNAGYESMANQALGVGAQTGFLKDANKQAQILGPLALQKAEFLKSIQKAAEAQKLGLAGAGGLSGTNPGSLLAPSSTGAYMGGIFNVANMNLQSQLQDDALDFQKWSQKMQFGGDALGSGLGALAFFCWVAEELWGPEDAKTHAARLWASTHDTPFTRLYQRHGRAWAAWLHRNEWAKPIVEPIWLEMARRGAAQAAGAVI